MENLLNKINQMIDKSVNEGVAGLNAWDDLEKEFRKEYEDDETTVDIHAKLSGAQSVVIGHLVDRIAYSIKTLKKY